MVAAIHVETVMGPFLPNGADIHDVSIDPNDPTSIMVFAGENASARLLTFDISGTALFAGETYLGPATDGFQLANFGSVTGYYSNTLLAQILNVAPGQMQNGTDLTSLNTGQASSNVAAVGVDIGGSKYLVASQPNAGGLMAFGVQGNGSLSAVNPPPDPGVGQISDLATVTAYGNIWVLATSLATDTLESYTIDVSGNLDHIASFGAPDGLGVNTPAKIVPIILEGQPHVVMASADSGSLSVLRLEADGSFTATDHVLDDLNTRFDNPSVLEAAEVGGTTFILAAGSDDGISLFRVLPDGTLLHLSSVADTTTTSLNNITAATLVNDGGALRIFLASATETGLSHLSYDISGLGDNFIGSSGGDILIGSALGDVLMGENGDDTIMGGGGNDILVDGAGADTLIGGAGADLFVFQQDGDDDTVQDFERGLDALDLSRFPLLHGINSLGFASTPDGARLSFQGEIIHIRSSDFNPLTLADLTQISPYNIDRPALVLGQGTTGGGQTQIGAGADDNLVGTHLNDTLSGNGGDDTLIGGAGADKLYGGIGFDTASFATATVGILLDRLNMSINTGDAAGDTFASIEAISGSAMADDIRGHDTGEHIFGNNGDDILTGRGGKDTLDGGYGDDILNGGTGGDILIGGDQTDRAVYGNSTGGLRIDLFQDHRNTGEATGDTYWSIEDLSGSNHGDGIYGNGQSNTIWGLGGDDWLVGRSGDDRLYGGAGNDVLDGGAGGDTLNGGSGRDRAQYFNSKSGLTVNLANPNDNTGMAKDDRYFGVEDVAGSNFNDRITGNPSANHLYGNGGKDRIDGGAGNDLLFGNQGADTFIFARGGDHDTIADLEGVDRIELDTVLLGSVGHTASAVIANFGQLSGTTARFDFGSGDILSIEGISDFDQLTGVFIFT